MAMAAAALASQLVLSSPEAVVQAQLDAYNAQNLDAFLATYSDHVVIADVGGAVTGEGKAALRQRYADMFKANPKNHADVAHRIVIGNKVIDHELVKRDGMTVAFEALAIYTINDGQIVRVDFVK
jgi:hypothetical protein